MDMLAVVSPYFLFGLVGLFSGHGWVKSDFSTYLFFTDSPFITSMMRLVAYSMESMASYKWNPLGLETTFLRVLFTYLLPFSIGWVLRIILIFLPLS